MYSTWRQYLVGLVCIVLYDAVLVLIAYGLSKL
jgi:hypothetical protein